MPIPISEPVGVLIATPCDPPQMWPVAMYRLLRTAVHENSFRLHCVERREYPKETGATEEQEEKDGNIVLVIQVKFHSCSHAAMV
jgi:hypothetical protein